MRMIGSLARSEGGVACSYSTRITGTPALCANPILYITQSLGYSETTATTASTDLSDSASATLNVWSGDRRGVDDIGWALRSLGSPPSLWRTAMHGFVNIRRLRANADFVFFQD